MSWKPNSYLTETQPNDHRFASQADIVINPVTLAANQVLEAGSVLGRVTATGEYVLSLAAASDGSQVPSVVLVSDCDTTVGASVLHVYEAAHLLTTFVKLGAGHTLASVRDQLRLGGIHLSSPAW